MGWFLYGHNLIRDYFQDPWVAPQVRGQRVRLGRRMEQKWDQDHFLSWSPVLPGGAIDLFRSLKKSSPASNPGIRSLQASCKLN